jgi:transposase-like protein
VYGRKTINRVTMKERKKYSKEEKLRIVQEAKV